MKKFILLLIIFFCTINTGLAETLLQGGVVYTVEAARKLAFDGLELKLDKQAIKPYLYDENNEENSLRSGAPSSLRSLSGRGNINNGQGS